MRKENVHKDLECQKDIAEAKRQRLSEQDKEIEDKIREKKILDK